MIDGPSLFARFAHPPNLLGYCGPNEAVLSQLVSAGELAAAELRHVAREFSGAWPYLEVIAGVWGRDPLDPSVVEAYWIGNRLLDGIDVGTWGGSVRERFRSRAGWDWPRVSEAVTAGGTPHHSFHTFCVYPWVGLLRAGVVEEALRVIDQCRIRWGTVMGKTGDRLLVSSMPLEWDGISLSLGEERTESVLPPMTGTLAIGDLVALHWDSACQKLTRVQLGRLRAYHDLHLAIANQGPLHRVVES